MFRILSATLVTLVLLGVMTGCAARQYELDYDASGSPLTGKAAEELAAGTDIATLSAVKTEDAPAMRARVLDDLRSKGSEGARAAELLTTGFPERTAAVPILVRLSSVDGTSAVVVVEAFGDEGGTLEHRRLWVFALESGSIVRAASFR